jgi:hypothetical protein
MKNDAFQANARALPSDPVYAFTRMDRLIVVGAALSAALTLVCVVGLFALLAAGR